MQRNAISECELWVVSCEKKIYATKWFSLWNKKKEKKTSNISPWFLQHHPQYINIFLVLCSSSAQEVFIFRFLPTFTFFSFLDYVIFQFPHLHLCKMAFNTSWNGKFKCVENNLSIMLVLWGWMSEVKCEYAIRSSIYKYAINSLMNHERMFANDFL